MRLCLTVRALAWAMRKPLPLFTPVQSPEVRSALEAMRVMGRAMRTGVIEPTLTPSEEQRIRAELASEWGDPEARHVEQAFRKVVNDRVDDPRDPPPPHFDSDCNKTLSDCSWHRNAARFGGMNELLPGGGHRTSRCLHTYGTPACTGVYLAHPEPLDRPDMTIVPPPNAYTEPPRDRKKPVTVKMAASWM